MQQAIFACGCFWGVQYYFDQVPGVVETVVGYTGGVKENPTYEEVCSESTGHVEAVQVTFNPSDVTFRELLEHFFLIHDPTRSDGQGFDIGNNYRPVVFCVDDEQKSITEAFISDLERSKKYDQPLKTSVEKFTVFWPAEGYHQKYAERTGRGMCHVAYRPLS